MVSDLKEELFRTRESMEQEPDEAEAERLSEKLSELTNNLTMLGEVIETSCSKPAPSNPSEFYQLNRHESFPHAQFSNPRADSCWL